MWCNKACSGYAGSCLHNLTACLQHKECKRISLPSGQWHLVKRLISKQYPICALCLVLAHRQEDTLTTRPLVHLLSAMQDDAYFEGFKNHTHLAHCNFMKALHRAAPLVIAQAPSAVRSSTTPLMVRPKL